MTESPAFRALMRGAIDYAGLFPPAALSMAAATANYATYRASPHAWMLGRFIVPAGRLEEFVAAFTALPERRDASPWQLSVIAKASDAAAIAAFNGRYGSRARIDTIEAPPLRGGDLDALAPLASTYRVYVEVPWAGDPASAVAALAARRLCAKIRTGGVTADAFPPPEAVARFIAVCRAAKVPFKATAGLHHAWRGEYPLTYEAGSARTTMHGFMNVLMAGVVAADGADHGRLVALLAGPHGAAAKEELARVPVPASLAEAGSTLGVDAVAAARLGAVTSFGSCSFDEPVAELTERGLL